MCSPSFICDTNDEIKRALHMLGEHFITELYPVEDKKINLCPPADFVLCFISPYIVMRTGLKLVTQLQVYTISPAIHPFVMMLEIMKSPLHNPH